MRQTFTLTILLFTLSFLSCRREKVPDLSLPAITQTGQNTLGFLMDDKVWINYGRRCTFAGCNDNKVSAYLYKQPNGDFDLGVSAGYTVTSATIDQSFFFTTKNVTTPGVFFLDSNLNRKMTFIASNYTQFYKEYKSRFPNSCVLNITKFDTANRIIAGTFYGVLYNTTNSNDSVKVQDGRFDAQLDYRR
jgi:hypothetical protein